MMLLTRWEFDYEDYSLVTVVKVLHGDDPKFLKGGFKKLNLLKITTAPCERRWIIGL